MVRVALVEGMLDPSAKARKMLHPTHRLDIPNPGGRLQLKLLIRVGKGAYGEVQWGVANVEFRFTLCRGDAIGSTRRLDQLPIPVI